MSFMFKGFLIFSNCFSETFFADVLRVQFSLTCWCNMRKKSLSGTSSVLQPKLTLRWIQPLIYSAFLFFCRNIRLQAAGAGHQRAGETAAQAQPRHHAGTLQTPQEVRKVTPSTACFCLEKRIYCQEY